VLVGVYKGMTARVPGGLWGVVLMAVWAGMLRCWHGRRAWRRGLYNYSICDRIVPDDVDIRGPARGVFVASGCVRLVTGHPAGVQLGRSGLEFGGLVLSRRWPGGACEDC